MYPTNTLTGAMCTQILGLVGKGVLVLNLTTLADILLGTVDTWNHAAIRELNPMLASLLPSAPITVTLPGQDQVVMCILTKSLWAASALFDQMVTDQLLPNPEPILVCNCKCLMAVCMQVGPNNSNLNLLIQGTRWLIIDMSDLTLMLSNTTNAMGVWMHKKLQLNHKLGMANFINPAGNCVAPSAESLQSTINNFSAYMNVVDLINGSSTKSGAGVKSWLMATYHQFIIHQTTMPDCVKARGLVDWIFWIQTDPMAMSLASQCAQFLPHNHNSYSCALICEPALLWWDG